MPNRPMKIWQSWLSPRLSFVGWRSALTWWVASNLMISKSTAHQQPEPTPKQLSLWSIFGQVWNPLSKAVLGKCSLGCTCEHLVLHEKLKNDLLIAPNVLKIHSTANLVQKCYRAYDESGCSVMVVIYSKTFNIRCTKSQNLNDSHLVLQLSLPNPLEPGVESRMKM